MNTGLKVAAGLALAGIAIGVVLASRPAAAASTGGAHCSRTDFGGLKFIQVLTGGAVDSDDVPVHVYLHGLGNVPQALVPYMEKFELPARHIILEGPVQYSRLGHAWTRMRCAAEDQEGLAAQMTWSANRVEQALDQISECFGGRKIVLSGFSNGGSIAYAIAARDLIVVDGVVVFAGCLPPSLRAPVQNTVGIHGTADDTVPFAATAEFARNYGVDWRPIEGGGHGPNEETFALWRAEVTRLLTT